MEKRVTKWFEKGLIDENTFAKLLKEVKEEKEINRRTRMNVTLYTIAAIFLGIGIITFIASNDWILKLLNSSDMLKILLMLTATLVSLWGGYELAFENKKFPKLGHSLLILSSLLIGGTYALVGQIYNINANNSAFVFVWLLSVLPMAYLFKNSAINIISIVLYILGVNFYYEELAMDFYETHIIFIPILLGISLYSIGNIPVVLNKFNNFSLQYKIVGALPLFLTILSLICYVENSYHGISAYTIVPIVLLILLNILNYVFQKESTLLLKIETSFINIILCLYLIMVSCSYVNGFLVMIIANILLVAMISFGFNYGYKFENEKIVSFTNWMLLLYSAVNYCKWGWSLLDKALFFIIGGLILLTLGLFLEKSKKKYIVKESK